MKLQHLLQQIYYEPSLITPDAHASIRQLIESRLQNSDASFAREPGQGICGEAVEVEEMEVIEGIAHIPVNGAIGQKLAPFERGDGAVDTIDIFDELDLAEDMDDVRGILLDIDSPGGMVTGTPELADRIARVRKPIYAFTNGMIASAAYWLASSTNGIFSTKSASIGSIGVYLPVFDTKDYYEQQGVKVELIKAGKLKGIGFPGTSLSEAGREHLQARVNSIYTMFTGHVRQQRGHTIHDDTMQGQTFMADEAETRGLIDGVVENKSEVLELLS
jgi:signal peptide peptidase SppA